MTDTENDPKAAPPDAGNGTGLDFDRRDFCLILGLFLAGLGLALIYPPAALIIPGLILVGIAIFGVRG